jgi:hypothetical protein
MKARSAFGRMGFSFTWFSAHMKFPSILGDQSPSFFFSAFIFSGHLHLLVLLPRAFFFSPSFFFFTTRPRSSSHPREEHLSRALGTREPSSFPRPGKKFSSLAEER